MAISGLSIAIHPEEPERTAALEALQAVPELTLGPRKGHRIAAVLETDSPREDVRLVRQIQALAGVLTVDVVAVFYAEAFTQGPQGAQAGESR